jgi:hypothetical protein
LWPGAFKPNLTFVSFTNWLLLTAILSVQQGYLLLPLSLMESSTHCRYSDLSCSLLINPHNKY